MKKTDQKKPPNPALFYSDDLKRKIAQRACSLFSRSKKPFCDILLPQKIYSSSKITLTLSA